MKRSAPTVLSLILIMVVSSSAFAGNIAGGRAVGNIAGGRTAGHIAGGRASGHIAGGRTATVYTDSSIHPQLTNGISRYDETPFSGAFAGLIRMLLESGAML
jgi:hypothetical protein